MKVETWILIGLGILWFTNSDEQLRGWKRKLKRDDFDPLRPPNEDKEYWDSHSPAGNY